MCETIIIPLDESHPILAVSKPSFYSLVSHCINDLTTVKNIQITTIDPRAKHKHAVMKKIKHFITILIGGFVITSFALSYFAGNNKIAQDIKDRLFASSGI